MNNAAPTVTRPLPTVPPVFARQAATAEAWQAGFESSMEPSATPLPVQVRTLKRLHAEYFAAQDIEGVAWCRGAAVALAYRFPAEAARLA